MTEEEQIERLVAQAGLNLAGSIFLNPAAERSYFVPVMIERNGAKQTPSWKELGKIREEAERLGYVLEFLLTDESAHQMEEGLRASFLQSFPGLVRNVYLSTEEGKAKIWIEEVRKLDKNENEKIKIHAEKYAELFSIKNIHVYVAGELNLATGTEILTIVREQAPATCESVRDALLSRKFDVPSLDWINKRFDALRRAGLLVRMSDRRYALTLEALRRLGTMKNRRSADVSRLLALARRRR